MSKYVQGENRNHLNIIPISLYGMIPHDNPARVIDALVDMNIRDGELCSFIPEIMFQH